MRADGQVRKGSLVLFTAGSYSSYGVTGLWKIKASFNLKKAWDVWRHEHPKLFYGFGDGKDNFLHELTKRELIEEVHYDEFHSDL
jgi:hypothetical protein